MPSKEETADRLEAILAEDEPGDGPYPELDDDADELEAEEEEEAEEEAEEETAEARSSTRDYIVLIGDKNGGNWAVAADAVQATSAEGAIRSLGDDLENGITYVAVPKRNWNPVPVTIKTTTTISFT